MRILLVMLLTAIQAGGPAPDAPTATIANDQVKAVILLPDAKTGYYRGARFDWAGQVSSLTWGGTLATATGLVIVAEDGGALMAVDASSGKPLWTFQTNANWRASPMTYTFDGRQHIAIAAGANILSFALPK